MKKILSILLCCLTLSCSKDETLPIPIIESPDGVFICNEGNFMYGNASLSFYNPYNGEFQNQLFYKVNNFPLGDVCQSMMIIKDKGFIVLNNSGKVVVMDINTYKYIGTIKGLTSPRYIEQISHDKIYITDLYSRSITVANLDTYQVTGYVYVGNSTEQIIQHDGFVYACSWSFNNKIYKIDSQTDKVVDSLTVTKQPNSMVVDRLGKIWVLSDGGYVGSPYVPEIAALTKIDTETFTISKRFDFPNMELSPSELCMNGTRDTLYYINGGYGVNTPSNGIYKMPVSSDQLPSELLIKENGALFYALGVSPRTSEIYVSDAIDYVQRGTVIRFSAAGIEISRFKTDINPGSFCFKY